MTQDASGADPGKDRLHAKTKLGSGRPPSPGAEPSPRFDADSLVGILVDNYHIEGLLGSGGFGAVYRARDTKLDRVVALKFLKNPLEQIHRDLFEREAKALAALSQHPSIVQIYGWGEYRDFVYFILEYLPAGADALVREYPRGAPLAWSLQIVRETAAALHYAHENKFLHRDVKPENILIDSSSRRIKLADFGLVSMVDPEHSSILSGRVSGSPPYMSPEQASGEPLDARSDIYSLGVTLYKLLSGMLPMEASSPSEMLEAIRNDQRIPLSERRRDLPPDVLALVDRATAFRPSDRFANAADFSAAIDAHLADTPRDDSYFEAASVVHLAQTKRMAPAGKQSARRAPWLSGVAVVAALLVVAGALLGNPTDHAPQWGIAEAAERLLNAGDYEGAEASYRTLLAEHPGADELLLGMGYALLHQGRVDESREVFGAIGAEPMRQEGLAAIAFARGQDGVREELETLADSAQLPYVTVLIATLDLTEGNNEAAAERLSGFDTYALRYAWQVSQALTTLGQAHYRLGNPEQARAAFAQLVAAEPGADARTGQPIAEAYLALLTRQEDARVREAALTRARNLGERIRGGEIPVAGVQDTWSSRPLRFLVLPCPGDGGRFARETGLVDVLPELLGRHLDSHPRMEWVDRDELDVLLAEQELSSYLGSDAGRLQLGLLLGARLIVEGNFLQLFNEESLTGKIVDTETSLRLPAREIPLVLGQSPRDAVAHLAESIGAVISEHYPLKGRLSHREGTLAINLGGAMAIAPGTRFLIMPTDDLHARPLENVVAVVETVTGANESHVRVEGADLEPDQIAEEGLFVVEKDWYQQRQAGAA